MCATRLQSAAGAIVVVVIFVHLNGVKSFCYTDMYKVMFCGICGLHFDTKSLGTTEVTVPQYMVSTMNALL